MSDEMNLMLYVAAYNDAASAKQDFESLKAAEGDDLEVEAAVVIPKSSTPSRGRPPERE